MSVPLYDPRVGSPDQRDVAAGRGLERRGHLTVIMMIVDRPAAVEDHSDLAVGISMLSR